MPNRIIKESVCCSETINQLSAEEECFFYRLMVNCDDFGRMDARSSILLAKCFPLRIENMKTKSIDKLLASLIQNKLVFVYNDGKCLQMVTWDKHQQIRAKRSKYPKPTEDDINGYQMISDDCICHRNPIQSNPILIQSESESNPIPYGEIMECFNKTCISLPTIKEITKARKTAINGRWKQLETLEGCNDFFESVQQSDWLSGRNDKGWKASFDWIFKASNFVKITEGNFVNKKQPQQQTQQPKQSVADKAKEAAERYAIRHGIKTGNSNERNISLIEE
jgi:hypothetical protein